MQTQCPECLTTFNITQQHLDIANGQVRCTQCQTVFDGREHMQINEPPEPPHLDDIAAISEPIEEASERLSPTIPNPLIYSDLIIEDDKPQSQLSKILGKTILALLSLILLCTLVIQAAYLKRSELVHIPEIAPYIEKACNAVPQCSIPTQRALDQFQLENRHIYAHPNITKALVVTATFRNNADFQQPYPTLILSMSNVRGQEVATRRFKPEEYLDKFTDAGTGMAPQQASSISLELADPGEQAMAFEIDFQ